MKIHTTDNAKSLVSIIGKEYHMACERRDAGYISPDQMLGTVLERLNRFAHNNINLRLFLDTIGHIPEDEDERKDVDWAEDPRDPRDMDVRDTNSYLRKNKNRVGEKSLVDRNCENVLNKAF